MIRFILLFGCLLPVYRLHSQSLWSIFAGNGTGASVPGSEPTSPLEMALPNVYGIEVFGVDVFFSTVNDHSIWRMDLAGKSLRRVAGNGRLGLSGDDGPALSASFNAPHEIRVDPDGNVYIADTRNHCVRWIEAETGIVRRLAGDGSAGFEGDGGPGVTARFDQPHSIVLDGEGGVLVADTKNHRLRRIDLKTRVVETISGDGKKALPVDGKRIDEVSLFGPRSLAIDDESIWLVLREGNSVWRIDRKSKRIYRVAGTGKKGHTGDGGDPLVATFRGPKGIAVDSRGRLLVVDTENQALRVIDRGGNTIRTADIGFQMKRPHGAAVWPSERGDVYLVSDSENHRVLACKPVPRE
ncbi:MAG: hypothetical protein AAFX06_06060 [Planctomycetota bacterium]